MISAGRFFVVLIMTVGASIATWQFSAAGGAWQNSVRQEIRHSAALQEDVRFVYADEAPLAFRAATARARADRLREVRPSSRLAVSEYTLASQTAFGLTSQAAPDSLLGERELADGDLGYNVPRRLAQVRAREPALRDLDPDAAHRQADRYALRGGVTALVVAALAVAVAVVAARRRLFAPGVDLAVLGPAAPAAGFVGDRSAVALRLVAWVLLVVLPLAGLWTAAAQQRAQAVAARQAVQLSTGIAASGERASLLSANLTAVEIAELQATARELAALDADAMEDADAEYAVAAAEQATAAQARKIANAMGRMPAAADGVDAATVAALSSTQSQWPAMRREQSRQVDLAERAGRRGALIAGAAALTAVGSAVLVAVAGRFGSRRVRRSRVDDKVPGSAEGL
jgi:hypothetical protein